jgi:hypothetical protein
MRKFFSLLGDLPSDVGVTSLMQVTGKRAPPSARGYINTLLMTPPVSIGENCDPGIAQVTQNFARALLVIQNESFATVAGDIAPTMYFGFGMTCTVGNGLALPPGVGIVLDVRVPANAIYCTLGPSVNTGSSVVIQGMIQEGGISNPEIDTVNITETGQITKLAQAIQALIAKLQ